MLGIPNEPNESTPKPGTGGEPTPQLAAVPHVTQPHPSAGQVGVEHAADDLDTWRADIRVENYED